MEAIIRGMDGKEETNAEAHSAKVIPFKEATFITLINEPENCHLYVILYEPNM
jgi:hypothetical protein